MRSLLRFYSKLQKNKETKSFLPNLRKAVQYGLPKEKALLIKAQKNWIAFRDSDCEFAISAYEGGSIQPLIKYTCLTEATQKRIEELENYLKEN